MFNFDIMVKMTTLRLLDLYWIPYKEKYKKLEKDFYEKMINIIVEKNINKEINYITDYYKNRKSNKEEYLLAYN